MATLSGFLLAKTDSDPGQMSTLKLRLPRTDRARKRLVSDYGCASCHEIGGIKNGELAPELSRIGKTKTGTQLVDFLPAWQHTASGLHRGQDQAAALLGKAWKCRSNQFTPAQIDSLATALLALQRPAATFASVIDGGGRRRVGLTNPRAKREKADDRPGLLPLATLNGQRRPNMAQTLPGKASSVQRQWLCGVPEEPNTRGRR